ncbi:DUF3145 family protein [Corynebacterium sp. 335C]
MRPTATTGVAWIHRAAPALVPHLAWALARAGMVRARDGARVTPADFAARPAGGPGAGRACLELAWSGDPGSAGRLAADLSRWPDVVFEIAVDAPAAAGDSGCGERICHVPGLGTWSAATDAAGGVVVGEDALRAAMRRAAGRGEAALRDELDAVLGTAWDAALEPLRPGTAGHDPVPAWAGGGCAAGANGTGAAGTAGIDEGGDGDDAVAAPVVPLPSRRAVM